MNPEAVSTPGCCHGAPSRWCWYTSCKHAVLVRCQDGSRGQAVLTVAAPKPSPSTKPSGQTGQVPSGGPETGGGGAAGGLS